MSFASENTEAITFPANGTTLVFNEADELGHFRCIDRLSLTQPGLGNIRENQLKEGQSLRVHF